MRYYLLLFVFLLSSFFENTYSMDTDKNKVEAEINQLNITKDKLVTEIGNLNKIKKDLHIDIDDLDAKKNDINKQIKLLVKENEDLDEQHNKTQDEIDNLIATKNDLDDEKTKLEDEKNILVDEKYVLEGNLKTLDDQKSELENKLKTLDDEKVKLEAIIKNNKLRITDQNERLVNDENTLKIVAGVRKDTEEQIQANSKIIEGRRNDINSLEKKYEEIVKKEKEKDSQNNEKSNFSFPAALMLIAIGTYAYCDYYRIPVAGSVGHWYFSMSKNLFR